MKRLVRLSVVEVRGNSQIVTVTLFPEIPGGIKLEHWEEMD